MKEKSFSVYGIKMPKIKEVLPTNLPAVQTNELRLDNLFLLEDDSMILVDYESEFRREDIIDYLNYICRILKTYTKRWRETKIRVIILYTSDVERAESVLDIGCLRFTIEQAFLMKLNTNEILKGLRAKIDSGKNLTEREQMELMILPLTVKGNENKQKLLLTVVELARKLPQESNRTFVLAGLLTFSDKIISNELADSIRRELHMLKVEKIIFEEGLEEGLEQGLEQGLERGIEQGLERGIEQGLERGIEQGLERGIEQGLVRGIKQGQIKTAIKMLEKGLQIEEVAEYTELAQDNVKELKEQLQVS